MRDVQELLADYVNNGSESAFRAIVDQYLNLVYGTALRLVQNDAHRAQDVPRQFSSISRTKRKLYPRK